MSDTVQPSEDFNATCMAVAWALFAAANLPGTPEYTTDPFKIAKRIHELYQLVATGRIERP